MNVWHSACALELADRVAYLWHSDTPNEFEKVINILSLLIPMFPFLHISTVYRNHFGSRLTV
jgi:hypothetical protein